MKFVYDSSLILFELTNKFNDEYNDYTLRSNTFVDDYINLRTKMKEDNFEKPKEYVRGIRLGLLFHLVKFFQYDSFIFNSLCQYTETFFDVLSRAFNDNSQNKGEKGMMLFLNKCKKGSTSKRNSCKNLFIYLLVFKFSFKFFGEKNAKPFIILINKNKSLIYETSETKDIILNILYSCNFRSEVIYESQDLLVDFLENMPIENLTERNNILKAVTYLFSNVGRISLKNVKGLTKLIIDNKYPEIKYNFGFMMKKVEFLVECITKNGIEILVNSFNELALDYIAFLVNYHYDSSTMFDLLKKVIVSLTFNKKKVERKKLIAFVKKLRERNFKHKKYDFEMCMNLENTKIADKDEFLQIEEQLIFNIFLDVINESFNNSKPVDWAFLVSCAKYYETRLKKYDLLVNRRILDLCIQRGEENVERSMLLLHYLFENEFDFVYFKLGIMSTLVNPPLYKNITKYPTQDLSVVYRCPDIIVLKRPLQKVLLNDVYGNDYTQETAFLELMSNSLTNSYSLFIISEIIYGYPRYVSFIDLAFIKNIFTTYFPSRVMCEEYLNEDENGIMIALNFLSTCFQTNSEDFLELFFAFSEERINSNNIEDLCFLIILFCNLLPPLETFKIESETGEQLQRCKSAIKRLLHSDIFEMLINKIISMEITDKTIQKLITDRMIQRFQLTRFNDFLIKEFSDVLYVKILQKDNSLIFLNYRSDTQNPMWYALNLIYKMIQVAYEDKLDKCKSIITYKTNESIERDLIAFYRKISHGIENVRSNKLEKGVLTINSPFQRFKNDYESEYVNSNSLFLDLKAIVQNRLDQESLEISEEQIGVLNGWNLPVEKANSGWVSRYEQKSQMLKFNFTRLRSNLTFLPIDSECLKSLPKDLQELYMSNERYLLKFYTPVLDNEIISEEDFSLNINQVVDGFLECKFNLKLSFYNILTECSNFKDTRKILLKKSIKYLMKKIQELDHQHEKLEDIYESVARCLDMVQLITYVSDIMDFDDRSILLVSTLFLSKFYLFNRRILKLIDHLDLDLSYQNVNDEFRVSTESLKVILTKYNVFKYVSLIDTYKCYLDLESKKHVENIISRMDGLLFFQFASHILIAIDKVISTMIDCEDTSDVGCVKRLGRELDNLTYLLFLGFKGFSETSHGNLPDETKKSFKLSDCNVKSLHLLDTNYLMKQLDYTRVSHNNMMSKKEYEILIEDMTKSIKDRFEPSRNIISSFFGWYHLYEVYFKIYSIYEGLLNYYIAFFNTMESQQSLKEFLDDYNHIRNNFAVFLKENMKGINDKIVFADTHQIEFLMRFDVVDFENKNKYLINRLSNQTQPQNGYLNLSVNRNDLLHDSLTKLMKTPLKDFKYKKLKVDFKNEQGVDGGGLTREWMTLFAKNITNIDHGLFCHYSENSSFVFPSINSKIDSKHLSYFRIIGRLLGKSIVDQIPANFNIDKTVYKYILEKKCSLHDLKHIEPQIYKSLLWIQNNSIDDVLKLNFSTDFTLNGITKVINLKAKGSMIDVTDDNKQEYIELFLDHRLFYGIEKQLKSLKQGLYETIDKELLLIFSEDELSTLISGVSTINIYDWKQNTDYTGYTSSSPNIKWFWTAVRSFTEEEKAKLLQFSTGSSRVGIRGFRNLQGSNQITRFMINKSSSQAFRLPTANTCINQLNLPEYKSYLELRNSLLYAITECSEGYAFQ